jgi:hypothetical protein
MAALAALRKHNDELTVQHRSPRTLLSIAALAVLLLKMGASRSFATIQTSNSHTLACLTNL